MPVKFTVFNKDHSKKIKKILKENEIPYSIKNKIDIKNIVNNNSTTKNKPQRKKLTKDQKIEKKKKRTPEEQKKINERMAKLRNMRCKKKK